MSSEAKAGILVVVSAILVIIGLAFLREYSFKKDEYQIKALFDTVIGLEKDDPVIVSGLKVGKVQGMHLIKDQVEVTLSIDARYRFPEDSKAILKNLTLLGEKAIEIERGQSSESLPAEAVIEGTLEADIFELTEAAAPLGEDLAVLLKRFRSTFDDKAESNIQASLENIEAISSNVAQNIGEDMENLRAAIRSMSLAAQNLESLTNPKGKNIDEVLENLQESSVNLKEASARIRASTTSLEKILSQLEKGEGTVGRLLMDDKIYKNLEKISSNIDTLILDVKKNPRKYIKIELF
jgi:phospholipid/cholesterol/gamma-HCH transport system substrate-binding protein